MSYDIRNVRNITDLISYFSQNLDWDVDINDFDNIEDISYDFSAQDIGLKEESFAKISSLRQLQPLVDGQKWGIFCVEFDSNRFEPGALRKILSGLVPRRRNSADHAVWIQQDLLFICNWGTDNNRTIGIVHFEDKEKGLPQIKMISCAPALEDFTQIKQFEERLSKLRWPKNTSNIEEWRNVWSSAFTTRYHQVIQDSSTLTIQLAAEAQEIRNRILDIFKVETRNGYVHQLYEKFRNTLVQDMKETDFADMYAQTLVYGLFSARCMDETQNDFSALEAIECIPNTNPFLKNLMKDCLSVQNNSRLSFDELEIENVVELLKNTQTSLIIQDFNRQTGGGKEDPVIHFYEEFLTAYDKAQKVQRGVFYTPQPVVNFMVNAVDYLLKEEFGYKDGLATTETKIIEIKRDSKTKRNGYYYEVKDKEEVPAVQILDPATGTGTFMRQIILKIYENFKEKNNALSDEEFRKAWNDYVPKHLLPRLNAFELMMAPYAVAHMKLAMVLKDTGYEFKSSERLNVFLTNTLEEPGDSNDQMMLWDDPLASESVEANKSKKNPGISVIIGNPPYSGESSNKGHWIMGLMDEYKTEPGGDIKLKERNPKWLNDDYVKFIRYSENVLAKQKDGILTFINPHGFIDNPTFRGMRWHLTQTFSAIYIIDIHGNVNKHEKCPDGSKDENVFDIQQGVCILIGVINGQKNKCQVYHSELFGLREKKYNFLNEKKLNELKFDCVELKAPQFYFRNINSSGRDEYDSYVSIKDLFLESSLGVVTANDKVLINEKSKVLCEQISNHYGIKPIEDRIYPINYRPFDKRLIYYDKELIERSRPNVMPHFTVGQNIGIVYRRQSPDSLPASYFFVCDNMMADGYIRSDNKGGETVSPLYLYNDGVFQKRYNFNTQIIGSIEKNINMKLSYDECDFINTFDGNGLISYIYAVLYSNKYRNKYREFIKKDYPRIPITSNKELFKKLSVLGRQLIKLHLMKEHKHNNDIRFYGEYNFTLDKPFYQDRKIVMCKAGYYFDNIDKWLWEYYIGGYQPLQKWAKDHKGLRMDETMIFHYMEIINIIIETEKIVHQIDEIIIL